MSLPTSFSQTQNCPADWAVPVTAVLRAAAVLLMMIVQAAPFQVPRLMPTVAAWSESVLSCADTVPARSTEKL